MEVEVYGRSTGISLREPDDVELDKTGGVVDACRRRDTIVVTSYTRDALSVVSLC